MSDFLMSDFEENFNTVTFSFNANETLLLFPSANNKIETGYKIARFYFSFTHRM
jgi:hypothetical protein